jgi:ABC-type polysaccharide/polyol phosphate export permease
MIWQKIKSVLGLSWQIAKAGFKLRNEGSYLGIFWYLLNPILMFTLLFFVFFDRLGNNISQYALYLLMGVIMFNFFQSATLDSSKVIKENNYLIKSVNFPRESLVFSGVIRNLLSHFFEVALFFVLALFFKISLIGIFWYFFILIFFILFVAGFSLVLCCLELFFYDIDNIWNFAVRILWLATPIFFAIEGQTRLFYANLLNPLYYFVSISRDLVVYNKMPELYLVVGSLLFGIGFLLVGLFMFNKLKGKFAELI